MGLMLFAANEGLLDDVELKKTIDFEEALLSYFNSEHTAVMAKINETGAYDDDIAAEFTAGIEKFKSTQTW
jgi:F-type H+-transporting ATPase subunit alpha